MKNTMKTGKVGTLGAESRFTYGGVEWVALDARPNMTLCLAADVLECRAFDEDNKNDFAASSLRAYLNGEFLERLAAAGADKDAFMPIVLDLTSDDGLDDYGTDTAKIGLLTDQMYRHFRKLIPNASDWWWTCTPFSTKKNGYENYVRYVDSSGALSYNNACIGIRGVRPLCALKSDILVSFDEEQIKERTPSFGEMIARGLTEGLREMFCGDEKEGGKPETAPADEAAADQPDEEAHKRAQAVDMMKHIAAAFDIPATIDEEKHSKDARDVARNDMVQSLAAAQKQFQRLCCDEENDEVDIETLNSLVVSYVAFCKYEKEGTFDA